MQDADAMQDAFIYYSLLGKPRNHDEMAYKSRGGVGSARPHALGGV